MTTHFFPGCCSFLCLVLKLDANLNKVIYKTQDIMQALYCEKEANEVTTKKFAKILKKLYFVEITKEISKCISCDIKRFLNNEKVCLKLLEVFEKILSPDESK